MSKIVQNLVVLMDPSWKADETPLKAGNMILNRFCIDEEAAFELSGVSYLKMSPREKIRLGVMNDKIKVKGKGNSFL